MNGAVQGEGAGLRWVEREFEIHLGQWGSNQRDTREGETRGPFGIHDGRRDMTNRLFDGRWILTHLPTGASLHGFPKRAQAKKAADLLVSLAGGAEAWEALKALPVPDALKNVARRAIMATDPAGAKKRWPDFVADATPLTEAARES